jgi:AraC-like DNA-binding protein
MIDSYTSLDIDEFTGQMVGWESDWRRLRAGQGTNRIDLVAGSQVTLQRVFLSQAVHQQGDPPQDLVTFGLPIGDAPAVWRGEPSDGHSIYGFNSPNGYDCVSREEFAGVTLSFARKRFVSAARGLGLEPDALLGGNLWKLERDSSPALHVFHRDLQRVIANLSSNADCSQGSGLIEQLDEQLPERLVGALALATQDLPGRALYGRRKGMLKAIEYMEEHCHRSPGIPEICVAVGLSWRSLDRAFKECYGVGPKRYLLNLRLTQARRDLKGAGEDTKVADVANAWGFWHMGDFAREYSSLFGELPTETLFA